MKDLYYVGTVKTECVSVFDLDNRTVLVRCESGYLSPGQIVEFHIGQTKRLGTVVCTSLISEGSDDEARLKENAIVYDVDKVYHLSWEKKKEEETDGN